MLVAVWAAHATPVPNPVPAFGMGVALVFQLEVGVVVGAVLLAVILVVVRVVLEGQLPTEIGRDRIAFEAARVVRRSAARSATGLAELTARVQELENTLQAVGRESGLNSRAIQNIVREVVARFGESEEREQ